MNKIKELIHNFGILVIRTIWPAKGKGGVQKLGLVVLALGTLLGVSNASNLQEMLRGTIASSATQTQQVAQTSTLPIATTSQSITDDTVQTTVSGEVMSATPNIVDLIADSETIISGMVKEVTDGFENGVPYTQVTVQVSETLRGQAGDEYTFRQFGLTKPRKMENGKIYLGTTPEGWSRYETGQDTMLFLYQRASQTGLQTTVGLGQGKVVFQGGNAVSQNGNEGMFENVDADAKLLNDRDKRLLATKKGEVNADGFKSFVRRAVNNKWVEGGKLRHVKK